MSFRKILLLSTVFLAVCGGTLYLLNRPETAKKTAAAPVYVAGTRVMAEAWIYPDDPKSFEQLEKVGPVQAVKIEFLHINDDGTVRQIDESDDSPNGYSQKNVDFLKRHSNEQYITVSGLYDGTNMAMDDHKTVFAIANLADKTGFNVELDWEDYGSWTPEYYKKYKSFITKLRTKLHESGKKLTIDGPAINDQTSQDWYQWKYEELAPLVDNVVMMVYDSQFDTGVGGAVAPKQWSADSIQWLHDKAGGKGIVGIASHGYIGDRATNHIAVNNSESIARRARGLAIERTPDGELQAMRDDTLYVYADVRTMQMRLRQVEAAGFNRLSVWSIGSNPWFND